MSEIKIHKFFPVPVFEQKLDDYKTLNNELEKFIYDLKKEILMDKRNQMLVVGTLLFSIFKKLMF